MNTYEAYETYLNGNITDFKNWLKKEATKEQLMKIGFLWSQNNKLFMDLDSYINGEN